MSLLAKFRLFIAPSIFQAATSFLMLPIATLRLGPAEYGAFALISAIIGLGTAIACLGSSYSFAKVFSAKNATATLSIVTSQTIVSLATSILLAVLLVVAWSVVTAWFPSLSSISTIAIFFSAASMVFQTAWALAVDVLTLDGRAKIFSFVGTIQSAVNAVTLIITLFVFELGGLSLFISAFLCSLVVASGAWLTLRKYIVWPPQNIKTLAIFDGALFLTAANIIEVLYTNVERNLLAISSSIGTLGLYTHSQQYRMIIAVATKALARSIWPTTLVEARQADGQFIQTNNYWRRTHFLLSLIALFFAAWGDMIISILTHGKFMGAGSYAAMGIVCLLAQNTGKPHTGIIYAHGAAAVYSRLSIVSTVIGLLAAPIVIKYFSAWGALGCMFIQQVVFRIAVQRHVLGQVKGAFYDDCALAGILLTILLLLIKSFLPSYYPGDINGFLIALVTMFFVYMRMFWIVRESTR